MQTRNVPTTGPRYWTILFLTSVFGTNLGDFLADVLNLGHARGLPVLALAVVGILAAERWSKFATEVYYWAALVLLRTAATNFADLATHDLRLAYPLVVSSLTALLIVLLLIESRLPELVENDQLALGAHGVPAVNGFYWLAMLLAGMVGTSMGDLIADDLDAGLVSSAAALGAGFTVMLIVRGRCSSPGKPTYWLTVVAARAVGTNVGDLLVNHDGLDLGLKVAAACSGGLLLLAVILWPRQPASVPAGDMEAMSQ